MQFAAQAVAWQEKLVEISEENLKGAQAWVRDMKVGWRLGLSLIHISEPTRPKR